MQNTREKDFPNICPVFSLTDSTTRIGLAYFTPTSHGQRFQFRSETSADIEIDERLFKSASAQHNGAAFVALHFAQRSRHRGHFEPVRNEQPESVVNINGVHSGRVLRNAVGIERCGLWHRHNVQSSGLDTTVYAKSAAVSAQCTNGDERFGESFGRIVGGCFSVCNFFLGGGGLCHIVINSNWM